MIRTPIAWITIILATVLALFLISRTYSRLRSASTVVADPGSGGSRAGGTLNPEPTGPAPADPRNPRGSGSTVVSGDLSKVAELVTRYGASPFALAHAYRSAWQASQFRRLVTNEFVRAGFLGALTDREQLHLDLEYGVTNAAFFRDLFTLEVTEAPAIERPETLVKTRESRDFHDYNQRMQGNDASIQRIAGILAEYGLQEFQLVLRAAEDVALLQFCVDRQTDIESSRRRWAEEAEGDAEARARFEREAQAEIAASQEGIEAFWSVVTTTFTQMSGVADPGLFEKLRAARVDHQIRPVRPPAMAPNEGVKE